jgi:hypothetical protein
MAHQLEYVQPEQTALGVFIHSLIETTPILMVREVPNVNGIKTARAVVRIDRRLLESLAYPETIPTLTRCSRAFTDICAKRDSRPFAQMVSLGFLKDSHDVDRPIFVQFAEPIDVEGTERS